MFIVLILSVIVIYHSQGGISIESMKSEQKPLLTELKNTPSLQVNSAAYNIVWLISFHPKVYSKVAFADVNYSSVEHIPCAHIAQSVDPTTFVCMVKIL